MDAETTTFLQKDYELKIRYLADHYSRMWVRCNFFVGLQSCSDGRNPRMVQGSCWS